MRRDPGPAGCDFYPRSPCGERPLVALAVAILKYFYPRSPCGERRWFGYINSEAKYFYPRSPCGERPVLRAQGCRSISISIHALLAESDRRAHVAAVARCQFLSTLSLRRATKRKNEPKGAENISIHALLAESDGARSDYHKIVHIISIHALLAESDACIMPGRTVCVTFLSTLSLRRATHEKRLDRWPIVFLSTLSLRRATSHRSQEPLRPEFLSTLSLRRATILGNPCAGCPAISIHALLAESDQLGAVISTLVAGFLSTLSLRRATQQQQQRAGVYGISIHALLAESDNSRHYYCLWNGISIHALLAESDVRAARLCSFRAISIHALLAESDGSLSFIPFVNSYFYPRSPCAVSYTHLTLPTILRV